MSNTSAIAGCSSRQRTCAAASWRSRGSGSEAVHCERTSSMKAMSMASISG